MAFSYCRCRHRLHFHATPLQYQVQPTLHHLGGIPVGQGQQQQVYQRDIWFLNSQTNGDHWLAQGQKQNKGLIATLEYEVVDWKPKVKIRCHNVMLSLMGKLMIDVDLICAVPKVKDLK